MWDTIAGIFFSLIICVSIFALYRMANKKNKASKAQQSKTQSSKTQTSGTQTVPNSNAAISGLQGIGPSFTSHVGVSSFSSWGHGSWPSSGYLPGMLGSARDFSVVDYKPDVEIVERDGSAELITLDGNQFLRIENPWTKKVEYVYINFQASSIKSALTRLGKTIPNGEDFEFRAMLAIEECILHKAEIGALKRDAEVKWQRYLKLKELSLKPGTPAEGMAAVKAALKTAMEVAL